MTWKIKDKDPETNILQLALNMCGIGITYEQTMLIDAVIKRLDEKGEDFCITDAAEIIADVEQ